MSYALKIKSVDFSSVAVDQVTYVIPVPCTGISLNTDTLTFASAEDTYQLVATLTPNDTTDRVTWSSSNPDVASVENGLVTIHGIGSATITATCGEQTATASVAQTSIKPKGGTKVVVDYAPSAQNNNFVAVSSFAGQYTVGQPYVEADTDLHAQNGNTNGDVQMIRVPYGATKAKVATTESLGSISYTFICDTTDLVTVSQKLYPKYKNRITSMSPSTGVDVVYGDCIIFHAAASQGAKIDYVYFT